MAIPVMALVQQHDARRDILIELAARQHAAIEALVPTKLGAQSGRKKQPAEFRTGVIRNWGAHRHKNQLACSHNFLKC